MSTSDFFRAAESDQLSLVNDGALEVAFLGVGSAFAMSSYQSNFVIIKGDTHFFIDLGTKAAMSLHRAGLSMIDVENLLITHSHADHIGGFEEWCFKTRYTSPLLKGGDPGDHRPNLITTPRFASTLWNRSVRGGLEHSKAILSGSHLMTLQDYVNLRFAEDLEGYSRPVYGITVGEGEHSIDVKMVRTNHFPDSHEDWEKAFFSVGVLVDDRVFISGDTMYEEGLLEEFGRPADLVFHDCQDYVGGVHAAYEELTSLSPDIKEKTVLYHLPDGIQEKYEPVKDGFVGWARPCHEGSYVFD